MICECQSCSNTCVQLSLILSTWFIKCRYFYCQFIDGQICIFCSWISSVISFIVVTLQRLVTYGILLRRWSLPNDEQVNYNACCFVFTHCLRLSYAIIVSHCTLTHYGYHRIVGNPVNGGPKLKYHVRVRVRPEFQWRHSHKTHVFGQYSRKSSVDTQVV